MKRRTVILEPGALRDLEDLYDWIANTVSPRIADAYLDRVTDFLSRLDLASEHGAAHDDIASGLRTVRFERRLTVALRVSETEARVVGVFHGGQDWTATLMDRSV